MCARRLLERNSDAPRTSTIAHPSVQLTHLKICGELGVADEDRLETRRSHTRGDKLDMLARFRMRPRRPRPRPTLADRGYAIAFVYVLFLFGPVLGLQPLVWKIEEIVELLGVECVGLPRDERPTRVLEHVGGLWSANRMHYEYRRSLDPCQDRTLRVDR